MSYTVTVQNETTEDLPKSSGWWRRRFPVGKEQKVFLKHVLTLISGTAVAQLLQLVAMVFVGRLFTVADLAIYTLVMSVVSAVVPIAAGRYELAVVLPRSDDAARQLLRLCTWINTIVSSLLLLVMLFLRDPLASLIMSGRGSGSSDIGPEALAPWLLFAGPLVWLVTQLGVMSFWLTRTSNFRLVSENKIHQAVSVSALQVGTGALRTGVSGLLVATVVGYLAALINLARKTWGEYRFEGNPPTKREMARRFVKMPALNGPNAVVDAIRINGINLMIPSHFGVEALGQFGLAWRALQAPMGLINAAVSQVFFPQLARVPRGRMRKIIQKVIIRSVLLGALPFSLIWLFAPALVPLLFGEGDKWALAGDICRLLVPWLYLNFITSPISTVFVVVQRQFTLFVFAVAFMIVPLSIIATDHTSITRTISMVSWGMAGMLVIFIVLALWVSWQYDNGMGEENDEAEEIPDHPSGDAPARPDMTQDAAVSVSQEMESHLVHGERDEDVDHREDGERNSSSTKEG